MQTNTYTAIRARIAARRTQRLVHALLALTIILGVLLVMHNDGALVQAGLLH